MKVQVQTAINTHFFFFLVNTKDIKKENRVYQNPQPPWHTV